MKDPTNEWEEPLTDALPEAPASANIKVWIKDYGVQFTMRGKVMRDLMINMQMFIDEAIKKGWQPTWDKGTNTNPTAPSDPTAPICGIHGNPMIKRPSGVSKTTNKPYPAFWACPIKNADNSYCNFKPKI